MIPKKIVAIGASSCEGKVDPEGGGFIGRLRKWHETTDQHNSVYNLGIMGDITPEMLARLEPEAKPRKPDLIIIQCGLNDFRHEGSPDIPSRVSYDEFKNNVDKLVKTAQSIADVLVMSVYPINESLTTPVSWRPVYYFLKDAKLNAKITKEYCTTNNIPYVNIFDRWIKEDYKKYLHTDGLHTNSLGHEMMFRELVKKLEKIY